MVGEKSIGKIVAAKPLFRMKSSSEKFSPQRAWRVKANVGRIPAAPSAIAAKPMVSALNDKVDRECVLRCDDDSTAGAKVVMHIAKENLIGGDMFNNVFCKDEIKSSFELNSRCIAQHKRRLGMVCAVGFQDIL